MSPAPPRRQEPAQVVRPPAQLEGPRVAQDARVVAPLGDPPYPEDLVRDLAASFQAAVVETLVARTLRALESTGSRALSLGGGVACNRAANAIVSKLS